MRTGMVAIATAMLVGACSGETVPAANDAAGTTANEAAVNYQAAVLELSDEQRNLVMIRAIRDANLPCQQVTETQRVEGEALSYSARCDDGGRHVVAIAADGNAQVVSIPARR